MSKCKPAASFEPELPNTPYNHALNNAEITSTAGSLINPSDAHDGDFSTYLRWTGLTTGDIM